MTNSSDESQSPVDATITFLTTERHDPYVSDRRRLLRDEELVDKLRTTSKSESEVAAQIHTLLHNLPATNDAWSKRGVIPYIVSEISNDAALSLIAAASLNSKVAKSLIANLTDPTPQVFNDDLRQIMIMRCWNTKDRDLDAVSVLTSYLLDFLPAEDAKHVLRKQFHAMRSRSSSPEVSNYWSIFDRCEKDSKSPEVFTAVREKLDLYKKEEERLIAAKETEANRKKAWRELDDWLSNPNGADTKRMKTFAQQIAELTSGTPAWLIHLDVFQKGLDRTKGALQEAVLKEMTKLLRDLQHKKPLSNLQEPQKSRATRLFKTTLQRHALGCYTETGDEVSIDEEAWSYASTLARDLQVPEALGIDARRCLCRNVVELQLAKDATTLRSTVSKEFLDSICSVELSNQEPFLTYDRIEDLVSDLRRHFLPVGVTDTEITQEAQNEGKSIFGDRTYSAFQSLQEELQEWAAEDPPQKPFRHSIDEGTKTPYKYITCSFSEYRTDVRRTEKGFELRFPDGGYFVDPPLTSNLVMLATNVGKFDEVQYARAPRITLGILPSTEELNRVANLLPSLYERVEPVSISPKGRPVATAGLILQTPTSTIINVPEIIDEVGAAIQVHTGKHQPMWLTLEQLSSQTEIWSKQPLWEEPSFKYAPNGGDPFSATVTVHKSRSHVSLGSNSNVEVTEVAQWDASVTSSDVTPPRELSTWVPSVSVEFEAGKDPATTGRLAQALVYLLGGHNANRDFPNGWEHPHRRGDRIKLALESTGPKVRRDLETILDEAAPAPGNNTSETPKPFSLGF